MIAVNLTGVFHGCQIVGRRMLARRRGRIVNIASIAGQIGLAGTVAYAASKGGVVMLTRALAVEWAPDHVRVNAIAPSWFESNIGDLIHRDALTVNGRTIGENTAEVVCYNRDVIKPFNDPLMKQGGLAILRGNLCTDGAVIKPSAATPALMKHRGRAVVFETIEDLHTRIDDPNLEIDESSVMVLKNCGPRGYPGMAEVGNMPLPPKLLKRGVTDMVRISDARMSGTAYGTVVLHVAPEAAAGGNLALVENGDVIEMDVEARRLHLDVSDEELARAKEWLAGSHVMELQRNGAQAVGYGTYEALGFGWPALDRIPGEIRAVTKEEIMAVCRATFTPENAVIVRMLPE